MEDPLKAFQDSLDRRFFLEDPYKEWAYLDEPLPIDHGQTISQPSLVLTMTRLLDLKPGHRILEIGTGSGYQAAFLAHFGGEVYTIERWAPLSIKAQERLATLGYKNLHFRVGDGSQGWPEAAPFDRIMVTAAAGQMPQALLDQLAPLGVMVIPVGPPLVQDLLLVRKEGDGTLVSQSITKVRFVEMKGSYGWSRD